jgi:hypothetical protein
MENKYKIKICKGCDHLSIVPLLKTNIACCPDSNYVDVEFCSPNERKFLDEIKSRGIMNLGCEDLFISEPKDYVWSALRKKDFLDIDFKELAERRK